MVYRNNLTPMKAIRKKCLDCQGDSYKAIRECDADCSLHTFRMGKNPNRSGVGGKPTHADENVELE